PAGPGAPAVLLPGGARGPGLRRADRPADRPAEGHLPAGPVLRPVAEPVHQPPPAARLRVGPAGPVDPRPRVGDEREGAAAGRRGGAPAAGRPPHVPPAPPLTSPRPGRY